MNGTEIYEKIMNPDAESLWFINSDGTATRQDDIIAFVGVVGQEPRHIGDMLIVGMAVGIRCKEDADGKYYSSLIKEEYVWCERLRFFNRILSPSWGERLEEKSPYRWRVVTVRVECLSHGRQILKDWWKAECKKLRRAENKRARALFSAMAC